jgi:hypothetical protein
LIVFALVACGEARSPVGTGSTTAHVTASVCRDADGWARRHGWSDSAIAVRVGISPTRDHLPVFAVRVGDALWLTDVSPIGEGGTLTTPVNHTARILASEMGISRGAGDSPWAAMVPEARTAIEACGG